MKKITYGLLFSLLSILTGFAQVQIGSGNNTSQNIPFNTTRNFSYTQSIYLSSEINAAGTITSLQWYFDGNSSLSNSQSLVVYLGTTAKTNFTSSSDWIAVADLTQVYTGGITTDAAPGWKTITLTTPFVYDGVSNLVIAVDENMSGLDGVSFKFKSFQTSETRTISYANNTTNPNPASPPTTGGTANLFALNYLPNLILGGLNQTCPTPLNISFASVNDNSIVVNWENQGITAPAEGYEIYMSPTNTTPTAGTTPSFVVAAGLTTFTITGLLPTTTYYLWIKAKCATTSSSAFSELKMFTTTAIPVTAFFESFEGATVPNLPLGWSKILRGPSLATTADIKSAAVNINITSQSVLLSSSTSTAADDIMLVSTNVSNIASANNRLKFYARGSGVLQIGTLSSNDENAVFTNVEDVSITSTTAMYEVNFDYAISTDQFIGIRLNTTGSSVSIYIDDIRWESIPNCADVTEITVPEVTPTTATINWLSTTGGETAWDIAIAASSTLTPEGLPFSSSTVSGEYNATDLLENTEYKVWVRSVCGTDLGSWTGPVIFRTDCTSTPAFNENFDTTPTLTLPSCWAKILRGATLSSSANVRTIALNANSGANSLQLTNSSSTGDFDVIAVSPRLSTLSLGTYRLKFFAKGVGSLQIGTVDHATNSGEFTSLNTFTTTAAYEEYIYEFSTYSGSDTHIGIRLATATTNSTIYIDNVVWEPIPLCPDVTMIEVNNVTSSTATINWSEDTSVGAWNIAFGSLTDTDPSLLPFLTSTTQGEYNATDLLTSTTYKVWVRSSCDVENGAWIGPVVFTTSCLGVDTISENFDFTVVPAITECWSKIIRGTTVSTSASVTTFALGDAQSAPNVVKLFNSGSSGIYDIMLVSPLMNANIVNASRVKFSAKSLTDGGVIDIVTLNSNTATAAYTVIATVPLTYTMSNYVVNLDAALSTDTYVGFRLNATSSYKTIYVDDIVIEAIPTCTDVSGIAVNDVAATSVSLEWISTGTEASWDIALGDASATDPALLPVLSATFNSYVLSDLTASTNYKVWVRSVCTGENGAWIGPLSFSTSCDSASLLNENFNATSFPNLPICWTSHIGNGAVASSNVAVSAGGFQNTNGVTIYAANSTIGSNVILITPQLNNIGAANQVLTFKAAGSNNIEIGTLNSNSSDIVFTSFQSFVLTESMQDFTVDFSTYTGTNSYIGFRIVTGSTTTSSQYLGIDNVVWGPNLGVNDNEISNIKVYPNPVHDVLNITNAEKLNAIAVYNLIGQEVMYRTSNLATVDMSQLNAGAYLVKLISEEFTQTIKVIKN